MSVKSKTVRTQIRQNPLGAEENKRENKGKNIERLLALAEHDNMHQ